MNALVIRNPGEAAIEQVREPSKSNGSVLLKVRMVGLCGERSEFLSRIEPHGFFPAHSLHEVSATILERDFLDSRLKVGTDVAVFPYTNCGKCASCRRGRPNACQFNQTLGVQRDGALTELIVLPQEKLYPANLATKELCLVEPLTVGFHAVARGRVTATDTVAIFGCGGVGLGAVAASHFRGARTICIDVEDHKLELAKRAGANSAINTLREPLHKALLDMTDGLGPDVVIEAVGNPTTFRAAVEEVAFTGRVVYIGYAKEPVSYETKLFVQKELDILGARNAQPEDFQAVIQLLEAGKFPVDQAVSLIVPLEKAPEALRSWSENPSQFTKILVSLD